MTNLEKFVKVFGFMPDLIGCDIVPTKVCTEHEGCRNCPYDDWWNQEYVKHETPEQIAKRKGWMN